MLKREMNLLPPWHSRRELLIEQRQGIVPAQSESADLLGLFFGRFLHLLVPRIVVGRDKGAVAPAGFNGSVDCKFPAPMRLLWLLLISMFQHIVREVMELLFTMCQARTVLRNNGGMDNDGTLEQVERLKQALVDYALSPGFAKRLTALRKKPTLQDDSMENLAAAVESLLYEGGDGREPLLDRYLRTNKTLTPHDRAVYEAWRDSNVFGAFRIEKSNGAELLLHNLIDEMDYRTFATAGLDAANPTLRGGYVVLRLVPTANLWTISGNVRLFASKDRPSIEDFAVTLLKQVPRLPFLNPDKLESARAMVSEQHDVFVTTFGTHVVLGTGTETILRYRTFMEASNTELARKNPADFSAPRTGEQIAPDSNFPAELRDAKDVALFHHPVKSTSFLVGYHVVREAHRVPPATAQEVGSERIREYMYDDSVPAHIIADLAAQFPDTVSQAYRVAFSEPGFDWKNDGAALLMAHKPTDIADAHIPAVTSVPTPLRDVYLRLTQSV